MVNSLPTPIDSSTPYDTSPTPSRSLRASPKSSAGVTRQDSIGGANTRPAKFHLRSRNSTKEYDFSIARTCSRRLNLKGGVMSLVKGCLGGGLMCIHESYMASGLWSALSVTIALGLILTFCMYELTRSAQKLYPRLQVGTLSYPELTEAAFEHGPWKRLQCCSKCLRHLVEVFICINTLGACSVYQTMMARQIKQLMEGTEGLSDESPTVRVYIAILLVPCLLISVFTSLTHLAPFSIILDVFIVLVCITTIGYSAQAASLSPWSLPGLRSLDGLFELVGVTMFSMDGIVVTLAVENSLVEPGIFPLVLVIGMSIVVLLVMLIGSFGYWGFGDICLAPITINFPWGPFSVQLKMFLAIMMYITFALNFWVPSCLVWYYVADCHHPRNHWIWERVYRMLLVILTNIVALLVPSITVFIALLGSFCVSVLSLIIPALIALNLDWLDPGPGQCCWRVWKALFFVLLGLICLCIGTYANITELVILLTGKNNQRGVKPYKFSEPYPSQEQ